MRTRVDPQLDLPNDEALIDEWLFVVWSPVGDFGMISGHRLIGKLAWYWSAFVHAGHPLLHLTEYEVEVRPDRHVVKAPEMWAEHFCDEPLRQWTIGNEAYFTELDDPDNALGRAYGVPRPCGFDLEWYAIGGPVDLDPTNRPNSGGGYEQAGVVHGVVEVLGRPNLDVVEVPAYRWRRWTSREQMVPVQLPTVTAHTGLRVPFRFPTGAITDWVVCRDGFRRRPAR